MIELNWWDANEACCHVKACKLEWNIIWSMNNLYSGDLILHWLNIIRLTIEFTLPCFSFFSSHYYKSDFRRHSFWLIEVHGQTREDCLCKWSSSLSIQTPTSVAFSEVGILKWLPLLIDYYQIWPFEGTASKNSCLKQSLLSFIWIQMRANFISKC